MKKTLLAALAIAGFAVISNAGAQTGFTTGDTFLGVYGVNGASSSSYVVDLGNLQNGFTSFSLNMSSVPAANWYGNANYSIGIIGSDDNSYNAVVGLSASAFNNYNATIIGGMANINSAYDNIAAASSSGNVVTSSINDNNGVTHYTYLYPNANSGSFQSADLNGYGVLSGPLAAPVTAGGASGNLYLYSYNNDLGQADPGVKIGTYSMNNGTGVLTVNSVPEPTTYALFGFGALLLVIAYRRRTNA
jgi:hypothetical protein